MKVVAWICLGIIILGFLVLLYYLVVGAILFKCVFARRSITERVLNKNIEEKLKQYKVDLCWWEKEKFTKIEILSEDGLKLAGFYKEANSNKTAIIVHGFGGSHEEMQPYCKMFRDRGFNVLAIDNRTHGQSEGNCIGYGWLERRDIVKWIEYLNKEKSAGQIVLFGLSMGGSAVCMTSGERELDNVVAIISDCAYANAERQIGRVAKKFGFLFRLVKRHLFSYTKRLYKFDIKDADVLKQVEKTKIPMLLIHGGEDKFVPKENLEEIKNSCPKEKVSTYVVTEAKHALCYAEAGLLYEKRVFDFLKSRTLLN